MKKKHTLFLTKNFVIIFSILIFGSCEHSVDDTVKDIDGNVYKTVTIGNQIWMGENLRTTTYNDGTPITLMESDSGWNNSITGQYCWYMDDKATYGSKYGALYNWYAADRFKLCPDGWRVPNDNEWITLKNYLTNNGYKGTEGLVLKSKDGWNNGNGTDNYGFKALPGGVRYSSGFSEIGDFGYWWTSTITCFYKLYGNSNELWRFGGPESVGYSVRCIK